MTSHPPAYRPLPVLCALVAGDVPWREAGVPAAVVRVEVIGLVQDRLVYRAGDGQELTTSLPPSACLGLFATEASVALMQQVRDWLARQGATDLPEVTQVESEPAMLMRVLLARLASEAGGLAEVASSHARQVTVLRAEVETQASIRADLDRFIGDVGLASLVCVFATGDPDFETQIELTPGAALRQLLPVASTGVAESRSPARRARGVSLRSVYGWSPSRMRPYSRNGGWRARRRMAGSAWACRARSQA